LLSKNQACEITRLIISPVLQFLANEASVEGGKIAVF
jgi:hypothetical protein